MIGTDEQVKRTGMFQRWMEKRGRIQKSIALLLIMPLFLFAIAAATFWFQYYLPVPLIATLAFLGVAAAVFLLCVILALVKLKKLSEGDRLMWKMKLTDDPESS